MARIQNIIPHRLSRRRKLMGFNQKQVADKFGHKDATIISRWERGISQPSLDNAMTLAKLYHTSVEDIFHELTRECNKRLNPPDQKRKKKFKGRDP